MLLFVVVIPQQLQLYFALGPSDFQQLNEQVVLNGLKLCCLAATPPQLLLALCTVRWSSSF